MDRNPFGELKLAATEHFSSLDIYAAIGDSGNVLYVNSEKLTVVAVTGTFKPAVHDRIDLIQEHIEPLLDAPV